MGADRHGWRVNSTGMARAALVWVFRPIPMLHLKNLVPGEAHMFITLMDVVAWLVVIGLVILALMFAGVGFGALIGNILVAFRRIRNNAPE